MNTQHTIEMDQLSPKLQIRIHPYESLQSIDSNVSMKPVLLPAFPQFKTASARKSFLSPKIPGGFVANYSGNVIRTSLSSSIALSSMEASKMDSLSVSRLSFFSKGMTSPAAPNTNLEKIAQYARPQKSRTTIKMGSPLNFGLKGNEAQKRFSENLSLDQSPELPEASPKDSLFRKFQRSKTSIENLSEQELTNLAIEILKKPNSQRSPTEISILMAYVAHIDFFHDYDVKTTENCLRVMYHVALRAGETVFRLGDIGTTFWVVLRGSVSVLVNMDTVVGQDEKGENIIEKELREIRVLQKGAAFGELALTDRKQRAATIVCKRDCEFAVLDKSFFTSILSESMARKLFEDIDFLAALPIFKGWTLFAVKELFYFSPIKVYRRGTVAYDEDDQPEKMYIIKKGTFKVLKEIEIQDATQSVVDDGFEKLKKVSKKKKTVELGILGEKEVFGEEELIQPQGRRYKIVCDSVVAEVFEINVKEFQSKVLNSEHSKSWLESYIQSKRKYYQDRVKKVIDATHKHKDLLIFPKAAHSTKQSLNHPSSRAGTSKDKVRSQVGSIEETPTKTHSELKFHIKSTFLGFDPKYITPPSVGDALCSQRAEPTNTNQSRRKNHSSMFTIQQAQETETKCDTKASNSPRLDLLRTILQTKNTRLKRKKPNSYSVSMFKGIDAINKNAKSKNFKDSVDEGDSNVNTMISLGNLEKKAVSFRGGAGSSNLASSQQDVYRSLGNSIELEVSQPEIKTPSFKQSGRTLNSKSTNQVAKTQSYRPTRESIKSLGVGSTYEKVVLGKLVKAYEKHPSLANVDAERGEKETPRNSVPNMNGGDSEIYASEKMVNWPAGIKVEGGKNSIKQREVDLMREQNFKKLNLEAQKQKLKDILDKKGGKEYKRLFYSIEGSKSVRTSMNTEVYLGKEQTVVKSPKQGSRKELNQKGVQQELMVQLNFVRKYETLAEEDILTEDF